MANASRAVSPFPQAARKTSRRSSIDPDMLRIESGKPPPADGTRPGRSKFDALFDRMKPGDCVRCEPSERETVRGAMLKWAKRRGKSIAVRSQSTCADGAARVWMLTQEGGAA